VETGIRVYTSSRGELLVRFENKVAIVTGGTRGIGRAIAEQLASEGASIALVARKEAELIEATNAISQSGKRCVGFRGSMGDIEFVETLGNAVVDAFGRCDVVINNAATNPPGAFGPLVDTEAGAIRKLMSVNLEGPLALIRSVWAAYMRDHGGSVVNVASVGGVTPAPLLGAYNVSKAALIYLTKQLAGEVAPTVRVNAIAPGIVKTNFAAALFAEGDEAANAVHPLGRFGTAAEVANVAVFLASAEASWITGQIWGMDGGISVRQ
jgi:NAD(P)-dependent dehydrogenase (short-subunit alcohol dehydrogenase family)